MHWKGAEQSTERTQVGKLKTGNNTNWEAQEKNLSD